MSEWWEQTSKQMSEWPSTLRVYFFIIRLTMHSFVIAIVSTFVRLHPLTKSALVYVSKSIRLIPSVSAIWHSNLRWSASHNRFSVSVNQICIDLLSPCHWVGYRLNLSIGLPLYDISVGCHCRDSPADLYPTWNPTPIIYLPFFFFCRLLGKMIS